MSSATAQGADAAEAAVKFDPSLPPLAAEKIGAVATLPPAYPETWVFVDEAFFFNMYGGKVIVLDVAEPHHPSRIKGLVDKNLLGNFTQAEKRREFYIIETFHERGARGARTDVLVIYDKTTLSPLKELVWPETRLTALPERYAMAVSSDERLLYVANFSPAASFTVVDLERREIVETVGTPGCVLTYPTGQRSVTSLCSNGGMLTSVLKPNGQLSAQHRVVPFFDTDDTPIFERPAIIEGLAYFPSFMGDVHVVDLRGPIARHLEKWSLVNEEERKANWRPGGLALIDRDERGFFYIVMHPDGADGTHNGGGTEVWVFDPKRKQRVSRIPVPNWAISVSVTRGSKPLLVVTSGELNLDIFDALSGRFIQTVGDFGNNTPLLVHKAY